MGLSLIIPPTVTPLSLQTAKEYLHIYHSQEDEIVKLLLDAAISKVEEITGRKFINQTWKQTFPSWESLVLRYAPVSSIVSVKYIDVAGVEQTLNSSNYYLDKISEPHKVQRSYSGSFPTLGFGSEVVSVTFVTGYGTNSDSIEVYAKLSILAVLGFLFENRQAQDLPKGLIQMLAPLMVSP